MSRRLKIKVFLIFSLILFLSFASSVVHAISFEELVEEGKKLLGTESTEKNTKSLDGNSGIEITSDIILAENGDLNGNGEMDGGETVRFFFVISNGTDEGLPFSNLKTNIKRDSIHFIHNVKGVTGIDNNSLELPNIYLLPHSKIEISFDAVLNYAKKQTVDQADGVSIDEEISSEPILEDNKKAKLAQGIKTVKKYKPASLKSNQKSQSEANKKESFPGASIETVPTINDSSSLETINNDSSSSGKIKEEETTSPPASESANLNEN